jgi:hypothetical protein
MKNITPERMDELWQQAFDDTHEGGKTSHRFAALLFAEAAPVPEGWKLVPVELTGEMRKATDNAESVDEAWKSMLAAAPEK